MIEMRTAFTKGPPRRYPISGGDPTAQLDPANSLYSETTLLLKPLPQCDDLGVVNEQ